MQLTRWKEFVFLVALMVYHPMISAAEPPNWPFKNIPFGQPRTKVLQQFAGAEVSQDKGVEFDLGEYQSIADDLSHGIYFYSGLGSHLYSGVVTRYDVSYKGWADVKQISLYFSGNNERADGVLFLVVKHVQSGGTAADVFAGAKIAISRIVGMEPATTSTRRSSQLGHSEPAMVAKWDTSAVTVYYAVRNSWDNTWKPTWGFPIIGSRTCTLRINISDPSRAV